MHTFEDKKGVEWVLELDAFMCDRVQKCVPEVKIGQLIAGKAEGLVALFSDPVLFVRVLWIMVEEQAKERKFTPEKFGRSLGGNSLEDASEAFLKALADFCPRQQRTIILALLANGKEVEMTETETALAEIAIQKLKRMEELAQRKEKTLNPTIISETKSREAPEG